MRCEEPILAVSAEELPPRYPMLRIWFPRARHFGTGLLTGHRRSLCVQIPFHQRPPDRRWVGTLPIWPRRQASRTDQLHQLFAEIAALEHREESLGSGFQSFNDALAPTQSSLFHVICEFADRVRPQLEV